MSAKISRTSDKRWSFRCPNEGCGFHQVDDGWTFNGDLEKPSFTPSVRCWWTGIDEGERVTETCHFYVTDGKVQFLSDSTHAFAGQTHDLPDWSE